MKILDDARYAASALQRTLWMLAVPRLAQTRDGERDDALRRARDTPFDWLETIGVLAAVGLTTWLLRIDSSQNEFSLVVRYLIQLLAAVPLLLLLAGPFYLRCLRRGLDRELDRRRPALHPDPRNHHEDKRPQPCRRRHDTRCFSDAVSMGRTLHEHDSPKRSE